MYFCFVLLVFDIASHCYYQSCCLCGWLMGLGGIPFLVDKEQLFSNFPAFKEHDVINGLQDVLIGIKMGTFPYSSRIIELFYQLQIMIGSPSSSVCFQMSHFKVKTDQIDSGQQYTQRHLNGLERDNLSEVQEQDLSYSVPFPSILASRALHSLHFIFFFSCPRAAKVLPHSSHHVIPSTTLTSSIFSTI